MLTRVTQVVETRETAAPATAGELLDLVRTGRAATRSQLRALTGLSRTAVTARVSALTNAGLLLIGEELASTGGRPPGALVFNKDAGVVLAVAIGRSRRHSVSAKKTANARADVTAKAPARAQNVSEQANRFQMPQTATKAGNP